MGLTALHLILCAVDIVKPDLPDQVQMCSDCLGALSRVTKLPDTRIPTSRSHSDLLKTIMVHCRQFSFGIDYTHVGSHQDDHLRFHKLSLPAQLNCRMDAAAKNAILKLDSDNLPTQEHFPLEPVSVFAGLEKMTSNMAPVLLFRTLKQLTRTTF